MHLTDMHQFVFVSARIRTFERRGRASFATWWSSRRWKCTGWPAASKWAAHPTAAACSATIRLSCYHAPIRREYNRIVGLNTRSWSISGDVARYCDAINVSCDAPEEAHKLWVKEQGVCTNQGPQAQLSMMLHSLHKEASALLCEAVQGNVCVCLFSKINGISSIFCQNVHILNKEGTYLSGCILSAYQLPGADL